ncbi:hypothetical protein RA16_06905 [Levilactobacillus brevis]|uniref:hypothetical protein n=1 Tax=Levilactobacillus brevis TaxID=1580 RepID=UPI0005B63E7B|nr:hypothetical protein [Levilactobacillus brevis]KIR08699.1 hypothetical protein RA16_06905 [Levilactobacillus brevis]
MAVIDKHKQKKISFYELQQGKHKFDLKESLDNIFKLFKSHKYDEINELNLDEGSYYISAIERLVLGGPLDFGEVTTDYYGYAINIARVDSSQQVQYGDLSKQVDERAEVIDLSDADMSKVGPLFDSQFFIDPFYSVIAMGRTIGGVNVWALTKFMAQLFDAKGVRLAFIPDEKTINDVKDMTNLNKLTYKVARTEGVERKRDDARSEMGDVKIANEFSADEYEVTFNATGSLHKKNVTAKLLEIIGKGNSAKGQFDKVEKIRLEGIKDGHEVVYDLLKNKLTYSGKIGFNSGKGLTIKDNFDYLDVAYTNKLDFIENKLSLKVYEINDEGENKEK